MNGRPLIQLVRELTSHMRFVDDQAHGTSHFVDRRTDPQIVVWVDDDLLAALDQEAT